MRRRLVKIEKGGGEPSRRYVLLHGNPPSWSRYGNPPSWTVTYECGHVASKPHSGDLSMKSMFLRRNPDTYLVGNCKDCD